jgi:ATP-dependent RNA helicase DDX54/DBP10
MQSSQSGSKAGPRFRHTKQKAPKMPDRYRDDYEMQKKKVAKAAELKKDGTKLRTFDQIRKMRAVQERKKKKNVRPSRKKK